MRRMILVVDDDPAVLQSYGRLLRRLGCQVVLSEDSEKVRTDPDSLCGVDLLILDQRMPKTTGLDLLAGLRRRGAGVAGCFPAVILISAFLSDDLRERASRLGVAEVIEKPINTAHLLESVRAVLEGRPPQEAAGEPEAQPARGGRGTRP